MFVATALGVFLIPVLYVSVQSLTKMITGRRSRQLAGFSSLRRSAGFEIMLEVGLWQTGMGQDRRIRGESY